MNLVPLETNTSPGDSGNPLVDGIGGWIDGTLKPITDGVTGIVNFATDPLGSIFRSVRDGAKGIADQVLPTLAQATMPDLSMDWFIRAYAISFALGILVWGTLMILNFVGVAKGKVAGEQFFESMTTNTGAFFMGAVFGPMIGMVIVGVVSALTDSLASWGIGTSADRMLQAMSTMLDVEASAIPGGVIIGIILMATMLTGLVIILVMLSVMLVTLYFSGAIMPLGWVWITSVKNNAFGRKIPLLWIGILVMHPLLFFVLGIAYNFIASMATWMRWENGVQTIMSIITTAVVVVMAALSPFLFLKFAPVIPQGAGGQNSAGISVPSKSYGPSNQREAKDTVRGGSSDARADNNNQAPGVSPGFVPAGGSQEKGSLLNKLRTMNGNGGDNGKAPGGSVSAQAAATKPGPSAGGAAPAAAGSGGGTGSGAAAGAGKAAAAGGAASSTGVGAAVGIPAMIGAGALYAGGKLKDAALTTARWGESGAQYAAGNMTDEGGTS